MTRPQILDKLAEERCFMDEGTFQRHMKELQPYGVKNKPRVGYYFAKR